MLPAVVSWGVMSDIKELNQIVRDIITAKYNQPASPVNYTVWYEYVSGKNPKLKKTIDSAIEECDSSHTVWPMAFAVLEINKKHLQTAILCSKNHNGKFCRMKYFQKNKKLEKDN